MQTGALVFKRILRAAIGADTISLFMLNFSGMSQIVTLAKRLRTNASMK